MEVKELYKVCKFSINESILRKQMSLHVLMLMAEDVVDYQVRLCSPRLCLVSRSLTRRKDYFKILRELACSLSSAYFSFYFEDFLLLIRLLTLFQLKRTGVISFLK